MKVVGRVALRDYSAGPRILYVSVLAAGLGAVSAVLAWALLEAIALATNLFYFAAGALSMSTPGKPTPAGPASFCRCSAAFWSA